MLIKLILNTNIRQVKEKIAKSVQNINLRKFQKPIEKLLIINYSLITMNWQKPITIKCMSQNLMENISAIHFIKQENQVLVPNIIKKKCKIKEEDQTL